MRNLIIIAFFLSSCEGGILNMGEEEKFEVKVLGPDTVISYVVDGKVAQKDVGSYYFISDGKYVETNAPIIIEKK